MTHSPSISRRWLACPLVAAFALLLPACAPAVGSLKGKVTYKGTNLKGGYVAFIRSDGGPGGASAAINEDGTYDVPKLTAGTYQVTVETKSLKPQGDDRTKAMGSGGPMVGKMKAGPPKEGNVAPKKEMPGNPADYGYKAAQPNDQAHRFIAIPDKYGKPDESGITLEYKGGSETFDIKLD